MRRGWCQGFRAVVVVVAFLATVQARPQSAMADPMPESVVNLGTQAGFARFALDSTHGHVFVSEPQAGAVVELNARGRRLATISGLPGAWGLAIGGGYLYVAAQAGGYVARIDLTASHPTPRTFVSGLPGPRWLAFVAGRLWIGTAPASGVDSTVVAVNPSTRAERSFGDFRGADFATSPADPHALYVAEAAVEPEPLHRYSLTTFPPRESASNLRYWHGGWGDMVLSADGSRLDGAAGGNGAFQELCSQTLQPDGVVYPGHDYPMAVAASASGLLATGLSEYNSPNLAVYRVGVTAPFWTTTSGIDQDVQYGGVAISANGRTLYAAVDATAPGGPTLLLETYALPAPGGQRAGDPCPIPAAHIRGTLTAVLRARSSGRTRKPSAAFVLRLTLRPRHPQRGYHYTVALTGLRCATHTNQLVLSFAGRRKAIPCTRRATGLAGLVANARRYTARVTAERRRQGRRPQTGRSYALVLRAP
jgi:hypothetical protein